MTIVFTNLKVQLWHMFFCHKHIKSIPFLIFSKFQLKIQGWVFFVEHKYFSVLLRKILKIECELIQYPVIWKVSCYSKYMGLFAHISIFQNPYPHFSFIFWASVIPAPTGSPPLVKNFERRSWSLTLKSNYISLSVSK